MKKNPLFFLLTCFIIGCSSNTEQTGSTKPIEQVQSSSYFKSTDILYRTEPIASGQAAKYYIVEQNKKGKLIEVLSRREGSSGVIWTKYEIDCAKKKMRTIAEAYDDLSTLKELPKDQQKWYELMYGSSKSDLFEFICK